MPLFFYLMIMYYYQVLAPFSQLESFYCLISKIILFYIYFVNFVMY